MTDRARLLPFCVLAALGCGSPRASGTDFILDTGVRPISDVVTVTDTAPTEEFVGAPDVSLPDVHAPEDAGTPPVDVPMPPVDNGLPPCRSSRDCSAMALVCDIPTGRCVECVARNDCPEGQSCVGNVCRAATCTPGTATCLDANTSRVCGADGVERSFPCATGQTCGAAGTCVARDRVCAPGAMSCATDGSRRVCNADGLGYSPQPCPALPNAPTSTCEDGACRPQCAAGFGNCDGSVATGCEARLQTDRAHCGACGVACAGTCSAGSCSLPTVATSCRAVQTASPGAPSGPYLLDPDGGGSIAPFMAYCEMTLAGGGWTLAAIITNNDAGNWGPRLPIWVDTSVLGDATSPLLNADAKSPAYNSLPANELMVVRQSTTPVIEVRTTDTCLSNRPLLTTMRRDAVASTTCAHSCTLAAPAVSPWSGGTCQVDGLHFRCRDAASSTTVGGYLVSTDDNSMISTSRSDSACDAVNFGLGSSTVGTGTGSADYDSDPTGTVTATDRVARLVYVR